MYDLSELTESIKHEKYKTHLETSGAYPLTGDWDWICFSPKKFKAPLPEVAAAAHELKIVVYHPSDLLWAEQNRALVSTSCKLYLQPEWSKRDSVMPLIIEYIKEHPAWEMSMQIHKYMQIP